MSVSTSLRRLKDSFINRSVFRKNKPVNVEDALLKLIELCLDQRDEIELMQKKIVRLENKQDYGARIRDLEQQNRDLYKRLQK